MSQEEFSTDEFQYLVNEMGQILEEKLSPLKRRLNRVEKRDQRARMSSSQKVDSRASWRYTSNDVIRLG